MARILLLISLALLIGIALSVPSTDEKTSSKDKTDKAASKEKHSKDKSGEKNSSSESHEKHASHEKHKKHKKAKSNEKDESKTKEVHDRQENHKKHHEKQESHEKHASHEKHDKHKKHDDKHKKDKHSKSRKHHRKHSRRQQKNDTSNLIVDHEDIGWEYENRTAVDTRRILYSKNTPKGKRPYMVYLQLTKESAKAHKYRGWLCGGVIVERYYVLTSAACVEDAEHFYIVSGTTKFVDSFDYKSDQCVCNNRRKVVWKCIPKNYKFDFQDSIKWSSNDIAIVKVNKPFKFGVVEKGCDFAADMVCYNNISRDLEKPGTKGWIAGWGSGSNFREGVYRRQKSVHIPENAKCLQEARVCIMDNEHCAKKWSQRFRSIIEQYMICTKDVMKRLSEICDKRYANCTDVEESRRTDIEESRRAEEIDLGRHLQDPDDYTARRSASQGGFCENDHGGPLLVKYQQKERVIGVISACKIDPKTHSCHGPFLYTSVFKNRQFISCSIYKDTEETCRRVFRTGITHEEWTVDWGRVKEDDDDRKDDDDE
ncbi:uncharacterized protein LOC134675162 [Cydia fagiglandana]|uniref:uncharacterized protein LOC134675162 n=1 Tax=Cydia fagiglandana TaxID=1458189 RepID=UPI002FEDED5C